MPVAGSSFDESLLPGGGTTPSQAARGHELDEQIEKALLELNDRYREALILRTVCGMTAREIADSMGLKSPEDAQKLFERARHKLAEIMGV